MEQQGIECLEHFPFQKKALEELNWNKPISLYRLVKTISPLFQSRAYKFEKEWAAFVDTFHPVL